MALEMHILLMVASPSQSGFFHPAEILTHPVYHMGKYQRNACSCTTLLAISATRAASSTLQIRGDTCDMLHLQYCTREKNHILDVAYIYGRRNGKSLLGHCQQFVLSTGYDGRDLHYRRRMTRETVSAECADPIQPIYSAALAPWAL